MQFLQLLRLFSHLQHSRVARILLVPFRHPLPINFRRAGLRIGPFLLPPDRLTGAPESTLPLDSARLPWPSSRQTARREAMQESGRPPISYRTASGLTVTRLQPVIGAEITGTDLCRPIPQEVAADLRQAL